MKNSFIFFFFVILFFSCRQYIDKENIEKSKLKYAKHFSIEKRGENFVLKVFNPWQNAQKEDFEYVLVDKKNQKINKEIQTIKIPVERVVCLSTTHLGFIEALNQRNSIVGLSGLNFVYDSLLNLSIGRGLIAEVGFEQNLNIEQIVKLKPDVVFAYDISGSLAQKYEQLQQLGVPVVYVAEYLENNPLGKAEWIKFFSIFFAKDSLGNEIFSRVESNYNNEKELVIKFKDKKNVLLNIPFNGIWYVPGGNSYMAQLIKDAGGNYLWQNNSKPESFTVSMEEIFAKNDSIDLLLNPSMCENIAQIYANDKRLEMLRCLKNKQVFNNNKRSNTNGGNDFWESGTVYPDKILKDLILIFNNQNYCKDSLFFYKKLN